MRTVLEQVHQRQVDHCAGVGVAEQLQPGLVRIDHDSFLHLQDGVIGTLQHGLQLTAVVAGGLQGGIQGALEPERTQFARNHRLHAIGGRQRDDIARADAHAARDVTFGNLWPHQQHRNLRRELVAHGGCLFRFGLGDVGADQQFRIQLLESFTEVADGGNPGAVHRFTGLAHQAVDELGGLPLRRENDERNGRIVRQWNSPMGIAGSRRGSNKRREFNTHPHGAPPAERHHWRHRAYCGGFRMAGVTPEKYHARSFLQAPCGRYGGNPCPVTQPMKFAAE